jgi:hypothetical protein
MQRRENMENCPNCKEELDGDPNECPYCFYKIKSRDNKNPQLQQNHMVLKLLGKVDENYYELQNYWNNKKDGNFSDFANNTIKDENIKKELNRLFLKKKIINTFLLHI